MEYPLVSLDISPKLGHTLCREYIANNHLQGRCGSRGVFPISPVMVLFLIKCIIFLTHCFTKVLSKLLINSASTSHVIRAQDCESGSLRFSLWLCHSHSAFSWRSQFSVSAPKTQSVHTEINEICPSHRYV